MGELGMAQALWELLTLLLYLIGIIFGTLLAVVLLSVIILVTTVVGVAIYDLISKRKQEKRNNAKTNR